MKKKQTQLRRGARNKWSARVKSLVKLAGEAFILNFPISPKGLVAIGYTQPGITSRRSNRQPGIAIPPFIYCNY